MFHYSDVGWKLVLLGPSRPPDAEGNDAFCCFNWSFCRRKLFRDWACRFGMFFVAFIRLFASPVTIMPVSFLLAAEDGTSSRMGSMFHTRHPEGTSGRVRNRGRRPTFFGRSSRSNSKQFHDKRVATDAKPIAIPRCYPHFPKRVRQTPI